MFMTACETLIFPWAEDPGRSNETHAFLVLDTPLGEWSRRVSRERGVFGDLSGFAVQTEADHEKLQAVCAQTCTHGPEIRRYFREQREIVGEAGLKVDPLSIESIKQAMSKFLSNPTLREELVHAGKSRARLFSFCEASRQTLATYERVAWT